MNGLQIKPSWKPAIPKEQRSFSAFFRPILPQLGAFHWIYPDVIPFDGSDKEFEALVEEGPCSQGYIPPNALLPKFAHFVSNDWVDLYGFQAVPDVRVADRLRTGTTDYDWISQHVDICFFNVDGAWWEIYARDRTLLEKVREHVVSMPEIVVQERVLAQRDILA